MSETLGREEAGWTRKRAEEALEERRVQVRKEGRRKLEPVTFATFAREWQDTYPDTKDLKRSTREGYESIMGRSGAGVEPTEPWVTRPHRF